MATSERKNAIKRLREAWESVKLDNLTPLTFKEAQYAALVAENKNRNSRSLTDLLPLPVARVKEDFRETLVESVKSGLWQKEHNPYHGLDFTKDLWRIHKTLFGENSELPYPEIKAEVFSQAPTPELHFDGDLETNKFYLCRIAALPFQAIQGVELARASQETLDMINQALDSERFPDQARMATDKLKELGLLKPMELDVVYLMRPYIGEYRPFISDEKSDYIRIGENPGTLHCSAEVRVPTPSVMIFAA